MNRNTCRSLKELRRMIDKHTEAISKERDALRELYQELEDVLEPTDRGISCLEEAIDAISERL